GAVIDRLDAPEVKQPGIVRGSGEAVSRLLVEHRANRILQSLDYRSVFSDLARVHEVARLNFDGKLRQAADRFFHLIHSLLGVISRKQSAVEHDSALALNRMRCLGK